MTCALIPSSDIKVIHVSLKGQIIGLLPVLDLSIDVSLWCRGRIASLLTNSSNIGVSQVAED